VVSLGGVQYPANMSQVLLPVLPVILVTGLAQFHIELRLGQVGVLHPNLVQHGLDRLAERGLGVAAARHLLLGV